jgi:hypothetical protein
MLLTILPRQRGKILAIMHVKGVKNLPKFVNVNFEKSFVLEYRKISFFG